MNDPHAYNITIRRANFEGDVCFRAQVKELPDLAEYADTYDEAYNLAIDAIETSAAVLTERGRNMPLPYDVPEDYSGRITLRLPKSMHRAIVEASEEEGVSINQYIVSVLSYYSGYAGAWKQQNRGGVYWVPMPSDSIHRQTNKPQLKLVHSEEHNAQLGSWGETG